MTPSKKLKFKTPAKINLGLHIHKKREDGFHELETLFQMVAWFDEIEMEETSEKVELFCDTPGVPNDENNLVMKAVRVLQNRFPEKCGGVKIRLKKNIPFGAGLGGGSGNAAGTLLALNHLWDLNLPREELTQMASSLGSDVPFFLMSPCAIGRGKGEILEPIENPISFYILMIYPGFPIATPWVYGNLKLKLTKAENNISILTNFLMRSEFAQLGAALYNDLELVVIKRYPEILQIKNELLSLGAEGALLSGSGSTVFGIFENPEIAKKALARFTGEKYRVCLAKSITRFSEFFPEEMLPAF
ncbi:MAG: 4-(cytidine 5'-diphospho)-2-C-methyl-D-erythritol kinase [Nitrospinae bacterium]|nr:4-(cytidine 5'-diphospho)-2-C-methyl-D-erythritol kinase [Nitrospinota bacterium]MZH04081.1 4-(cytidine 5'-diphospho)-2-C-methyl-D-erythritol kinase [Nitrospinota bacterium]MZH13646.1 4-(cytidine 5'-diphospho)-2-C-methyl-D-erythritol kinase [Nitrospinota bacterium]